MDAKAATRFVLISSRKAKLAADLIRGKPVSEALAILKYTPKKASVVVSKTLNSAIANAVSQEGSGKLDADRLYVKNAVVDPGPVMPRWKPRAFGRASRIRKRTSHIKVVVSTDMPPELKGTRKARKIEARRPKRKGKK